MELRSKETNATLIHVEHVQHLINDEGVEGLLIYCVELETWYFIVESLATMLDEGEPVGMIPCVNAFLSDDKATIKPEVTYTLGLGVYNKLECIQRLLESLWNQHVAIVSSAAQFN